MEWTKEDIDAFSIYKTFQYCDFLKNAGMSEVDEILHPEKIEKNRLLHSKFHGRITLKKGNLSQELEFGRDSLDELMSEMIQYTDNLKK